VCHECVFLVDEVCLSALRVAMLTFAEFGPPPRCRNLRRFVCSCSVSKLAVGWELLDGVRRLAVGSGVAA
jgi:hypothetical protein